MKWSSAVLSAALVLAATENESVEAFAGLPTKHKHQSSSFGLQRRSRQDHRQRSFVPSSSSSASTNLFMSAASSSPATFRVGIVGATGAVGKEIRQCLEKRDFPVDRLCIFGSERSAGTVVKTEKYGDITVQLFSQGAARQQCDVVFLAVGGDFSKEHAVALTAGDDGCVCIDNSSAFRYDPDIPLVVPEINGRETCKSKLIANPNCTTAIGLMALWPLHLLFGLKKIIMSTYQASSGAGQPGMDELRDGTVEWLEGNTNSPSHEIFAHPLPFNVIPHIDAFQDNGYTKEEMKVTWESRKICGLDENFPISCTAVRIPTMRAHAESIVLETEKPVDIEAARKALEAAPGVELVDDPSAQSYPMPLTATGQFDVQVGRLRKSLIFGDHGLELFVCGDQLLRGAALNAVLVAEEMITNGSLKSKASTAASAAAAV